MIQTLAILLGRLIQLPFLQGYRTIIAAVGLIGLSVWMISAGQVEPGLSNLFFALGLLGVRFAWTPAKPVLPSAPPPPIPPQDQPTDDQLDRQAELIEDMTAPREIAVFGATSAAAVRETAASRREQRQRNRQEVVAGLKARGVSNAGIAAWLPVIIALLQVMPDVLAVIQKIIDAIAKGRRPAQFAAEEKLRL